MPTHPTLPPAFAFISQVERFYAGLISAANPGPEPSLGGKLFYAGELDTAGRAMVVAANIAGAATLTATDTVTFDVTMSAAVTVTEGGAFTFARFARRYADALDITAPSRS